MTYVVTIHSPTGEPDEFDLFVFTNRDLAMESVMLTLRHLGIQWTIEEEENGNGIHYMTADGSSAASIEIATRVTTAKRLVG